MYLHLGNNKTVRIVNIIGIFDADSATVSAVTRQYLKTAERKGRVISANEEIPKSFVLYKENGEYKICFSQLSSTVLHGRMGSVPWEVRSGEENDRI